MIKKLYALRFKPTGLFFKFNQTHDDGYGYYEPTCNIQYCYADELPTFFDEYKVKQGLPGTRGQVMYDCLCWNGSTQIKCRPEDMEWVEFTIAW
jgi:hypothetical protein